MDLLLNAIKGQFNSLNFSFIVIAFGFLLFRLKRRKASWILFIIALVFFLVTSTGYLPDYLIGKMESKYIPFARSHYPDRKDTVFVQALGGGYTADSRLEPLGQLSGASLGRLIEAIRITRLLNKSMLILSGNVASGAESMASVSRRAAILLGVDSTRIAMLETPATTQQEAIAFAHHFGKTANLILVTDAIHMPRAMRFYVEQGITPFPAPTNFVIKKDNNPYALRWIPSIENMHRMDKVWREYLGSIKGVFMNSKSIVQKQ